MPPKSPTSRLDFSRRAEGGPQNIPYKEIRQGNLPYEEVDFSQNYLSANELPEVIKICKRCPKLRVLKLYKNCIDDYGAQDLAELCRTAPHLEEIHLSHNMFTAAGAGIIIKSAEEFRRPDTVPLWLRLEHNYVDDAEKVFQTLQSRYSVCRRTDAKLCTARTCHNRCRVHLPHFCLQRLSQVEETAKRSPTHANHQSLSGHVLRKFRADLERENKDKVKIDPHLDHRMDLRTYPMVDPRVEAFDRGWDPQLDDRRMSWTRGAAWLNIPLSCSTQSIQSSPPIVFLPCPAHTCRLGHRPRLGGLFGFCRRANHGPEGKGSSPRAARRPKQLPRVRVQTLRGGDS